MADIIDASGLSAGAIYLQFASKQDIVTSVAEEIVGHRLGEISARLAHPPLPDPDELIRILMDGLASELGDTRLLVHLWGESFYFGGITELVEETFGRMRAMLADYLARWAQQNRGLDPDAAAEWGSATMPALLGLLQGHIIQSAILPDFDPEAYRAAVRRLFS